MASPLGVRHGALWIVLTALLQVGCSSAVCALGSSACPLAAEAEESALLQIELTLREHIRNATLGGAQLAQRHTARAKAAAQANATSAARVTAITVIDADATAKADASQNQTVQRVAASTPHQAQEVQPTIVTGADASLDAADEAGMTDAPVNDTGSSPPQPSQESSGRNDWMMFFLGVVFSSTIVYAVHTAWYAITRAVVKAIEFGVEVFDRYVIGVDMEIGKLSVSLCEGCVTVHGLKMRNPEGYNSDHLLEANKVKVHIDMWLLITSALCDIRVKSLRMRRVDIIFEKSWKSSNVHDILEILSQGQDDLPETSPASNGSAAIPPESSSPRSASKDSVASRAAEGLKMAATKSLKQRLQRKPKSGHEHSLILEHVSIEDVGVRMEAQMLGGRGARIAVPNIQYQHFSREVGHHYVEFIIKNLLKTVLKSIVANTVGNAAANKCL